MNTILIVRIEIEKLIDASDVPGIERDQPIEWEKVHSISSSCIGAELAKSRNVDVTLAATACAIHDIGRIITGKQDGHAEAGAEPARTFLENLRHPRSDRPLFTSLDILRIVKAVAMHSNKADINEPLDEIVKDADILDMYSYGLDLPREEQRVRLNSLIDDGYVHQTDMFDLIAAAGGVDQNSEDESPENDENLNDINEKRRTGYVRSSGLKPIIKWPGGKSGEIRRIKHLIPEFERYIEPFFGGGALFFDLRPAHAEINDASKELVSLYRLIKTQDRGLLSSILGLEAGFTEVIGDAERCYPDILACYREYETYPEGEIPSGIESLSMSISRQASRKLGDSTPLADSMHDLASAIAVSVDDKMRRTIVNEAKAPFSGEDLKENLITGFAAGYYTYIRDVYNAIRRDDETARNAGVAFSAAVFYFIREYCYGSMFRYNSKNEFNIPYGGMTYNRKNLSKKIADMFSQETRDLFASTNIYNEDFENFLEAVSPNENDFIFLDPPYDSDFSEYEGINFTRDDHARLAYLLKKTSAKFILIIKNTEYISSLYDTYFRIRSFDSKYTYNMRSRNERATNHLIITNY